MAVLAQSISLNLVRKKKLVDFDKLPHQIGLEVIEGGRLNNCFTYYKSTFQLTSVGESETLVTVKVHFETELQDNRAPDVTIRSGVVFILALQTLMLNQAQEC